MLKEITIKASLAYNDEDFRETVEAFSKGMQSEYLTAFSDC
jgi:hypothetical protein